MLAAMARIRIVEHWLRSPSSPPAHQRAVMVVAEAWGEQRVLMRALADSPDRSHPTIVLHGALLAIGPAGLDPHGSWGIHVEPPMDGRAQELRAQLEEAARRLAAQLRSMAQGAESPRAAVYPPPRPPYAAAGPPPPLGAGPPPPWPAPPAVPPAAPHGHWHSQPAGLRPWTPPRHGTPNPAYHHQEPPASAPPWPAQPPGPPPPHRGRSSPVASAPPLRDPGVQGPAQTAANARHITVRGYAPGYGVPRAADPHGVPASRPGGPDERFASAVRRTMPAGFRLTEEERRVLDALEAAGSLTASRIAALIGVADGIAWMAGFMAKLAGYGLDVVGPCGPASFSGLNNGEPTYALKR